MNIVVLTKLVPDLVEELTIDADGNALDLSFARLIINEFDDHAIEQGILLKERGGGSVTIITPDAEGADEVLFTAAAKGADRIVKVKGDFSSVNNHAFARAFAKVLNEIHPDLILTGVQAHNDLDGALGPLIAELLEMPYIGYVSAVSIGDDKAAVKKEYPGGLIAEMDVKFPAVLGIQAAEQPPRYVAISKVRQAMRTASIEERDASDLDPCGGAIIGRMFQPEAAAHAMMITGSADEVADKLVDVFKELGIV